MQNSILLSGRQVPYTLKRRRWLRGMRLTVRYTGEVIVIAPGLIPIKFVEAFLKAKSDWVLKKIDYFEHARQLQPEIILTPEKVKQLKKQTLELVEPLLNHYGQILGVTWAKVSVKNITSRWGSCSRDGNLSFNCRIALLPPDLVQYIVVHELCHLRQFNHSPKFWALVYSVLPEYKSKVKYLKQHVMALS